MKKYFLVLSLLLIVRLFGFSADFVDNGFAYKIISELENLCSIEANEEDPYQGDVVIPSTVQFNGKEFQVYQIGEHAFSLCDGITSLTIPPSLKSIRNNSFDGCSNLRKIIIEDSNLPLAIGRRTGGSSMTALFYYAPLEEVYIGRDLTYEVNGDKGIYGPFSQRFTEERKHNVAVSFGEYVTTIPSYLFAYRGDVNKLTLGHNIKSIGQSAFNQSLVISSIIFPESIETIGTNAFYGNSTLSDIVLGANVKTLSAYAFASCSGLASVYCYALQPPTATYAAYSSQLMNARLRVPAESLEKYKTSSTWKEFGEILPFDDNIHFYPAKYKVSFFIPENGSFSQSAQEGTNLSFNIQPNDGWELHSLTINGSDKTVSVSGDFETGPIYSDIEILAVFQCTSTSIDTPERCSSDIRVAISGHTVNIQGKYNQMELYDISGDCILSGHQDSIAIEQPGLYILQIDGKPYKFMIR